jgi:glutaminyl-peptide cyclotransferase
MKRAYLAVVLVLTATLIVGLVGYVLFWQPPPQSVTAVNYDYNVVATFPHDESAWTEGLAFNNGSLFEGTGEYGTSQLRRVDLASGAVLQNLSLPNDLYGEGITVVNGTIVQLTWQNHTGFVYGLENLTLIRQFSYFTDGWGLTFDGANLIMSDGSDQLYFLDPSSFVVVRQVSVHDGNVSVTQLNELEFVNGNVYANIWLDGKIAIINPQTGQVTGWVDLGNLEGDATYQANGIAYDQQTSKLYVTGKNWPHLYQITLTPQT